MRGGCAGVAHLSHVGGMPATRTGDRACAGARRSEARGVPILLIYKEGIEISKTKRAAARTQTTQVESLDDCECVCVCEKAASPAPISNAK